VQQIFQHVAASQQAERPPVEVDPRFEPQANP